LFIILCIIRQKGKSLVEKYQSIVAPLLANLISNDSEENIEFLTEEALYILEKLKQGAK